MPAKPSLPKIEAIQLQREEPTAYFDLGLGDRVAFIDFNTPKFAEHLSSSGLNNEQISGSRVRFESPRFLGASHGHYDNRTNKIVVKIGASTTEARANSVVLHEAEHLITYANDECMARWWHKIGRTTLLHLKVSALYIMCGVAATAAEYQYLARVSTAGAGIAAAAGLLSAAMYKVDPDERRARRAEHLPHSFVTLTR